MVNQLILLAAPSKHNSYYKDRFLDIIKFQINFAKIISAKHHVIVLAEKYTIPYLTAGSIQSEMILEANLEDIWIRDFGTVVQSKPVMFQFGPDYLGKRVAKDIQNSFLNFLKSTGISIVEKKLSDTTEKPHGITDLSVDYYPELKIDGGNVVYNFNDSAIMCDRFFIYNKNLKHREHGKEALQKALGYDKVVTVTEYGPPSEDTCGHADGLVSFIDDNTIAYSKIEDHKKDILVSELRRGFGESMKLVELPSFYVDEKVFDNFNSACGLHVNALVMRDCIYMPTFGHDPESQAKGFTVKNDEEVYEIMQNNTTKEVVKVPVPYKVATLGGSVRCLSMQVEGAIAEHLISLASKKVNHV